jgi:nitroreductase
LDVTLDLSPDELLTTTRTVRRRLDFERPVDRALIEECIEIALQAPSGQLKQNWHWIVIDDAETKKRIGEIYADLWNADVLAGNVHSYDESDPRSVRMSRVMESAKYLANNIGRAPWLVIPCGTGRVLGEPTVPEQARFWSSILPAMWNFMLAARARGLGVAWTTEHLKREEQVAELLGIPYPEVTQCGLFPVAYSIGTDFKKAHRIAGSELTHWQAW